MHEMQKKRNVTLDSKEEKVIFDFFCSEQKFMFSFQKRQFSLNAYTFNLEYWRENDAENKEKIDCFNIDRFSEHTGIKSSIEIHSSSHTFLPETVRFYFNNQEDFEKVGLFLTNLSERRMKMDYKEEISWFYLNREYEMLMRVEMLILNTEKIWTDGVMNECTVRAYLKNLNVTDEKIFQMISEHFSRTNSYLRQGNIYNFLHFLILLKRLLFQL